MMRSILLIAKLRVRAWIKYWTNFGGGGAVVRQDSDLWLDRPFRCCTEECGYVALVAKMVARFVDASSSIFPIANSNFNALDKPFHGLHLHCSYGYKVKDNVFDLRVTTRGESCCFLNWHFVVLPVVLLISLRLLIRVQDCPRINESSRLLFVPTTIVLAYYLNFVINPRDPELRFFIAVS